MPVPRQTVMTKGSPGQTLTLTHIADNVSVEIDSVLVLYVGEARSRPADASSHITNPYRAAFSVADVRQALSERAQTTLRTVVGGRSLQQVIAEREAVALEIEQTVEKVRCKICVRRSRRPPKRPQIVRR